MSRRTGPIVGILVATGCSVPVSPSASPPSSATVEPTASAPTANAAVVELDPGVAAPELWLAAVRIEGGESADAELGQDSNFWVFEQDAHL